MTKINTLPSLQEYCKENKTRVLKRLTNNKVLLENWDIIKHKLEEYDS